ncbi:MAG: hypothetical protein JF619_14740 [Massilia sp.]|nr:hypothetical protein [Massilia sp.]
MPRFFPSLLLALCSACVALSACDRTPAADINMTVEKARKEAQAIQDKLAALPPQCVVGDADGTAGQWIDSRSAAGEPGKLYTYVFTLEAPIRSRAFRVALNAKALQNLETVETRDAGGTWSAASTGAQAGARAGCEFVKMAQPFAAGEREVTALRITIRPDQEKVIVANGGVLKAG